MGYSFPELIVVICVTALLLGTAAWVVTNARRGERFEERRALISAETLRLITTLQKLLRSAHAIQGTTEILIGAMVPDEHGIPRERRYTLRSASNRVSITGPATQAEFDFSRIVQADEKLIFDLQIISNRYSPNLQPSQNEEQWKASVRLTWLAANGTALFERQEFIEIPNQIVRAEMPPPAPE